jgi:hypothetical protein
MALTDERARVKAAYEAVKDCLSDRRPRVRAGRPPPAPRNRLAPTAGRIPLVGRRGRGPRRDGRRQPPDCLTDRPAPSCHRRSSVRLAPRVHLPSVSPSTVCLRSPFSDQELAHAFGPQRPCRADGSRRPLTGSRTIAPCPCSITPSLASFPGFTRCFETWDQASARSERQLMRGSGRPSTGRPRHAPPQSAAPGRACRASRNTHGRPPSRRFPRETP